jgi:hypothetical protein
MGQSLHDEMFDIAYSIIAFANDGRITRGALAWFVSLQPSTLCQMRHNPSRFFGVTTHAVKFAFLSRNNMVRNGL